MLKKKNRIGIKETVLNNLNQLNTNEDFSDINLTVSFFGLINSY